MVESMISFSVLLLTNATKQVMQNLSNNLQTNIFNIIGLTLVIGAVMAVVSLVFGYLGSSNILNSGQEPQKPEERKKVEEDARSILMNRYVKGEISDEEYTDKMSRL